MSIKVVALLLTPHELVSGAPVMALQLKNSESNVVTLSTFQPETFGADSIASH